MTESEFSLDKEKHIKYWQRCLCSLLPTQYTSTDSSRMTLAFFILSALDILNAGADTFPSSQRADIRNWILKCQHPLGGFCGSPNHKYPDEYYIGRGGEGELMDPPNLPATFFAILSLGFVDGLRGVKKRECLRWLRSLQREDGSFGELVTKEGCIEGGTDMRHCYVATAVRWMLRGGGEFQGDEDEEDISVEKLVDHLRSGQTYDGSISESSSHEAHAGYTYCAIASLSLLNRLPNPNSMPSTPTDAKGSLLPGLTNIPATIRWLMSRQIGYTAGDDEDDEEDEELPMQQQRDALAGIYKDGPSVSGLSLQDPEFIGFNGRCNKRADTCYTFWVSASLDMLGEDKIKLVNLQPIRRFLFEQVQHRIGGFGKCPGDPPDIYHSYLGLAALAVLNEPGVKQLDSSLCISKQQKEKMSKLRNDASVPSRTYWKHGYSFTIREDHPQFKEKMASSEEPPEYLTEMMAIVV